MGNINQVITKANLLINYNTLFMVDCYMLKYWSPLNVITDNVIIWLM